MFQMIVLYSSTRKPFVFKLNYFTNLLLQGQIQTKGNGDYVSLDAHDLDYDRVHDLGHGHGVLGPRFPLHHYLDHNDLGGYFDQANEIVHALIQYCQDNCKKCRLELV